ncbi:thioesterase family protein [Mycobacterium sp. MYCO198283]|uniref:thioesterase family protein n=1 Tax=Mycobacterium sp. MYCO198283 TaxID=2883505 RepID=UPI001E362C3A|nr:thioesterase family protein [Mycobacterium sp. MYCO198283]MCG5433419.1 thioesterase family protein [Mycobacterium sp. MYCO198283]
MSGYFYRRLDDDRYESGDLTRSNWAPDLQHGSPPLALLTRAIEQQLPPQLRIGRLTLDILGAIPVSTLVVRTSVVRPGRRISLLAAELAPADSPERPAARVTAWALATSDTSGAVADRHPPLVEGPTVPLPAHWWNVGGYLEAVEWRPQAETSPGGRTFWVTPTVTLVDGEEPTALQRMAMVVDSANGIGAALDPREYLFMNTDTAVHLHRLPEGRDFALRAGASIGPDGIGVTSGEVFDRRGLVGTVAQTLLVERR